MGILDVLKSRGELGAKLIPKNIAALKSAGRVAVYLLFGALCYYYLEDWPVGVSIYYLCVVSSTVGYGDMSPATQEGRLFTCVYAILGITVVFGTISEYAGQLLKSFENFNRWFLAKYFGVKAVDTLKIDLTIPPSEVNKQLNYPRRIALSLIPLYFVLILGTTLGVAVLGYGFIDALYWCVITATTIGFGDTGPTDAYAGSDAVPEEVRMAVAAVFMMLAVTCLANTVGSLQNIYTRKTIRQFDFEPVFEEMVLKAQDKAEAEEGKPLDSARLAKVGIPEIEFMVASLLHFDLVDEQALVSLRRQYHSVDALGDGRRNCLSAKDIFNMKCDRGTLSSSVTLPNRPPEREPESLPAIDREAADGGFESWLSVYWARRRAEQRLEKAFDVYRPPEMTTAEYLEKQVKLVGEAFEARRAPGGASGGAEGAVQSDPGSPQGDTVVELPGHAASEHGGRPAGGTAWA